MIWTVSGSFVKKITPPSCTNNCLLLFVR